MIAMSDDVWNESISSNDRLSFADGEERAFFVLSGNKHTQLRTHNLRFRRCGKELYNASLWRAKETWWHYNDWLFDGLVTICSIKMDQIQHTMKKSTTEYARISIIK